jgi:hypothetical protein
MRQTKPPTQLPGHPATRLPDHTATALLFILLAFGWISCGQRHEATKFDNDTTIVISKEILKDRIKGAWAAQTIGVTFGAPIEFQYNSTYVQDNQKLEWNDSSLSVQFKTKPGTYDDIYLDLTFMQVIEDNGIDAPPEKYADALGKATYKLWFANQTARYNIQQGLKPPQSGHWLNNPCADDIDFQIEADFAGLMAPGMVNAAVGICDKVGHIMNYGDGYYGGVFVAALYSEALVANGVSEIEAITKKALTTIPSESKFAQCISDVIRWHAEDPGDWKATWFKVNRKWATDTSSPLGIFKPFNIDAKINAAWVVMGLLYGNGDFTRTVEIATRCGDDADCNPASAAGILAAVIGYNKIPDYWKQGIDKVEAIPFMGTSISLLKAYDISYRHAEKMIAQNGGEIKENDVVIKRQVPATVPLEVSFANHYPVASVTPVITKDNISFEFDGVGFAVVGPSNLKDLGDKNYVFDTQMTVDGQLTETAKLPTAENGRRFTPFWKYQLPKGHHKVSIKILNPVAYAQPEIRYAIIYDDKPVEVNY